MVKDGVGKSKYDRRQQGTGGEVGREIEGITRRKKVGEDVSRIESGGGDEQYGEEAEVQGKEVSERKKLRLAKSEPSLSSNEKGGRKNTLQARDHGGKKIYQSISKTKGEFHLAGLKEKKGEVHPKKWEAYPNQGKNGDHQRTFCLAQWARWAGENRG